MSTENTLTLSETLVVLAVGGVEFAPDDLRLRLLVEQARALEDALKERDDALRVCLEAFENDYHKDPGGDYARLIRATLGMCPAAAEREDSSDA